MGRQLSSTAISFLPAWVSAEKLYVLVVNRNAKERDALVFRLMDEGFGNIAEAETANEALAWMHEREHPDVVICDCENDPVDGLQFCNMVRRATGRPARRIPVILLLSTTDPLVHEVARQVGAAGIAEKPATGGALASQIYQAVGRAEGVAGEDVTSDFYTDLEIARVLCSRPEAAAPAAETNVSLVGEWSSPEEYSVLVVEPETPMRKMIVQMLRQKGFRRTEEVATGTKALFLLQMGYLPDVVVCNVTSQDDHWEMFCNGIRELRIEALQKLPIVLLTADPTEELDQLATAIGFAKIVERPLSVNELADALHEMVGYAAN